MLIVGAVGALILLFRLLRLHLVPLDLDDLCGFLWIPHVAVDHVVEHRQTMVGTEHEFGGGIHVLQGCELRMAIMRRAHAQIIVRLLAPRGGYATVGGHGLCRVALAGIGDFHGRRLPGLQIDRDQTALTRDGHPAALPVVRGRCLEDERATHRNFRTAVRPVNRIAGSEYRGICHHGEGVCPQSLVRADFRHFAGRRLRSVHFQNRAVGLPVAVDRTVVGHGDSAARPELHLRRRGGRVHGFHIG